MNARNWSARVTSPAVSAGRLSLTAQGYVRTAEVRDHFATTRKRTSYRATNALLDSPRARALEEVRVRTC